MRSGCGLDTSVVHLGSIPDECVGFSGLADSINSRPDPDRLTPCTPKYNS